jgi:hypothetical protein
MAWYPGATKMELQPESDSQQAIRPTQLLVHSIVGPWTARRTYEYWRDSTNLESHFGIGYAGDIAQYIGTETRADANAAANRRPDGTGAISIETASNLTATDPWTEQQVEELIKVGVWAHQRHGIPLRLCRSATDPGFGWHKMFDAWNPAAHSCPGPARIEQFKKVVFPGIVARAAGTSEEDDMPTAAEVAKAVLTLDGVISVPGAPVTNPTWTLSSVQTEILKRLDKANTALTAQSAAITKLAGMVGEDVDTATVVAAVEKAIADAVVRVSVEVTDEAKGA